MRRSQGRGNALQILARCNRGHVCTIVLFAVLQYLSLPNPNLVTKHLQEALFHPSDSINCKRLWHKGLLNNNILKSSLYLVRFLIWAFLMVALAVRMPILIDNANFGSLGSKGFLDSILILSMWDWFTLAALSYNNSMSDTWALQSAQNHSLGITSPPIKSWKKARSPLCPISSLPVNLDMFPFK